MVCVERRTHAVRREARHHIPGSVGEHPKEVYAFDLVDMVKTRLLDPNPQ